MPFQSAPNMVEVVFDCLMSGAPTANVLHMRRDTKPTQSDVDALATNMSTGFAAAFLPGWSLTQSFVGVRVRGLTDQNDVQGSSSDGAGVGVNVEEALPNNVSLCLTLRTAVTGRSARGRWFCQPPNAGNMVTANTVSAAYRDAQVAHLLYLRAAAASAGWSVVILSRIANKVVRPVAVGFTVTSIVARNTRTDSQRGRLPAPE